MTFTISNILHSPVTSSLLVPNTFHSIVFLITLRLCSFLIVTDQISHPHKTQTNSQRSAVTRTFNKLRKVCRA